MELKRANVGAGEPRLGLWDAVSLIVGIIIGAGIFRTPADVFGKVPGPWAGLLVWVAGGVVALMGALCFAELASTYPRSGGEYVYLTRAFGPLTGYLFAWAQLTVIRPAGIAGIAYVFADYAAKLFGGGPLSILGLTTGSILVLTLINVLGVSLGSTTQNLLTLAKVLGLLALIVVGLGWGNYGAMSVPGTATVSPHWFAGAMIPVLWTYAGWHEAAYVAAEVKDRTRNLPRALLLGTAAVTCIYLLVNLAFLFGLGFAGAGRSTTLAADLLGLAWPTEGKTAMALLVSVSALGAVNGMIFTTARIYAEFGADHRLFTPLSRWSRHWGTPVRALIVQGLIALALVVVVWFRGGGEDGFDQLLNLTAAVFWCFFLLTGLALFVLRREETIRPFSVPLYPWLPLLFCGSCAYMVVGAIQYKRMESLVGLGILVAGLPFYFFPKRAGKRQVREMVSTPP